MLPEAQRAADVVRRLRDFFRTGTTRLEAIEVRELLAIARRIALQLAGPHAITVETEGSETLPSLFIDRLQMELVFRNLLSNAIESIISARLQDGRVNITAQRYGESQVRFVVSDSGPGILPARRPGLFEPFVSGKPTGMGLGLAVSRAIAEAHGGTLEAPAVEHGEFHLVLPCLEQI